MITDYTPTVMYISRFLSGFAKESSRLGFVLIEERSDKTYHIQFLAMAKNREIQYMKFMVDKKATFAWHRQIGVRSWVLL